MQHASSIPPETLRVLERLTARDDLDGFTLIGGTALALRYGHRRSEDIDLAWVGESLPTRTIAAIVRELPTKVPARNLMDPLDAQLAENDGFYLAAHQQDWSIDGVKVTFYEQPPRNAEIIAQGTPERMGNLAIADDETLFRMKCAVLLDRTTSRDLFDLWWFTQHGGKSTEQILQRMRSHDPHLSSDMHMAKLAPASLSPKDPGFDSNLPDAPCTTIDLLGRLAEMVKEHRILLAERVAMQAAMNQGQGL